MDIPIYVFSYSRRFYMGAHTLPAPTMFITIVPDYRLIDLGVQLPATAQDVQDAMQQVIPCHSAEAINMFAILDLPEFHSTALHPGIKRAVLLSERCMWPADMKLSYAEAKQKIGPLALLDSVILSPRLEGYRREGYLEKFGEVLGALTSSHIAVCTLPALTSIIKPRNVKTKRRSPQALLDLASVPNPRLLLGYRWCSQCSRKVQRG